MCTSTQLRGITAVSYLALFAFLVFSGTRARAQAIFNDDFDRQQLGSFWDGNGRWTILDAKAFNSADDNGALLTTAQSFSATSYVLDTEVSNLVGGYQRAYYLLFGQQDDSGNAGYVIRYDPLGGGSLVLGRATDNYFFPEILDRAIINLDAAAPATLRVAKYENGLIQVYVAGENDFPDVPTLEAIDTTYPALSKVSWVNATQTAGEDFFVEYVRAEVPETQKTEPEKPVADELVQAIQVDGENDYELSRMTEGETFYTDRPYTLTDVPDFLEGARFIKTANDDKLGNSSDFLTVFLTGKAIAYVAYDPRATVLPDWLRGWTKTGEVIGTTDPGSDYFEVYTNLAFFSVFGPSRYRLSLGAALAAPAAGSNMNYIVALLPYEDNVRLEAETATLSGARPASNQTGFSGTGFADYINAEGDYIEWTVDVAATSPYNLFATYANGSAAARNLQLSIDGEQLSTMPFTPTRLWTNWASRRLGNSVLLAAGEHRIRLTATGTSGPNLDYLELSPTAIYTPPFDAFALSTIPLAAIEAEPVRAPTVSVFPNPTVSAITFRLSSAPGASDLQVTDIRGREIYRQSLTTGPGDPKFIDHRVEVGNWPAGTYLYRMGSGGEAITGKFVKMD